MLSCRLFKTAPSRVRLCLAIAKKSVCQNRLPLIASGLTQTELCQVINRWQSNYNLFGLNVVLFTHRNDYFLKTEEALLTSLAFLAIHHGLQTASLYLLGSRRLTLIFGRINTHFLFGINGRLFNIGGRQTA